MISNFKIQDESGEVEVIQWVEEGQTLDEFAEGTNVKVFGSIRLVLAVGGFLWITFHW